MVAEMSGHDAQFIMQEMPLARCYQFRTAWFDKHGIEWKVLGENESAVTIE